MSAFLEPDGMWHSGGSTSTSRYAVVNIFQLASSFYFSKVFSEKLFND